MIYAQTLDEFYFYIYKFYQCEKMKSLVEYINERGPASFRLKCSVSGKAIPDEMVLDIGMKNNESVLRVFKKLANKEFGDDYVICRIIESDPTYHNVVDTENTFRYEKGDGGIIVNNDDDREIYTAETVLDDAIGIVVFDRKKFESKK